jgi:hypothetical protein
MGMHHQCYETLQAGACARAPALHLAAVGGCAIIDGWGELNAALMQCVAEE